MELMELFAKIAGRFARNFRERPQKIGIIAETALERDTVQAFIAQHLLARQHNPAVQDVVIYAAVGEARKLMRQVGRTDIEKLRQVIDVQLFRIVVVDMGQHILDNAVHDRFTFRRRGGTEHVADHRKRLDHEGIILKAAYRILRQAFLFLQLTDQRAEFRGGFR